MRSFIRNNSGIVVFLVGILCFRTAIADWSPIPSPSMEPTIFAGDVVLVNKTLLGPAVPFTEQRLIALHEPERGDIITFQAPHEDQVYIKRVIGVPGDRIRSAGLRIWVNDELLPLQIVNDGQESGLLQGRESIDGREHLVQVDLRYGIREIETEILVPAHAYFVMGDFRNNSQDSRFFGFVPEANILGRATRIMVSIAGQRNPFTSIGAALQ